MNTVHVGNPVSGYGNGYYYTDERSDYHNIPKVGNNNAVKFVVAMDYAINYSQIGIEYNGIPWTYSSSTNTYVYASFGTTITAPIKFYNEDGSVANLANANVLDKITFVVYGAHTDVHLFSNTGYYFRDTLSSDSTAWIIYAEVLQPQWFATIDAFDTSLTSSSMTEEYLGWGGGPGTGRADYGRGFCSAGYGQYKMTGISGTNNNTMLFKLGSLTEYTGTGLNSLLRIQFQVNGGIMTYNTSTNTWSGVDGVTITMTLLDGTPTNLTTMNNGDEVIFKISGLTQDLIVLYRPPLNDTVWSGEDTYVCTTYPRAITYYDPAIA
jgi:hypothetical protein